MQIICAKSLDCPSIVSAHRAFNYSFSRPCQKTAKLCSKNAKKCPMNPLTGTGKACKIAMYGYMFRRTLSGGTAVFGYRIAFFCRRFAALAYRAPAYAALLRVFESRDLRYRNNSVAVREEGPSSCMVFSLKNWNGWKNQSLKGGLPCQPLCGSFWWCLAAPSV